MLKSSEAPVHGLLPRFLCRHRALRRILGLDCALKFFGTEKMVFASDAPFGPIKLHTDAIDTRGFERATYEAITRRNAEKLLNMSFS